MTDRRPETFTDLDLRAYLAGALAPDVRARIDVAVETDADLLARIEALDPGVPGLDGAFAALLAAAPTATLSADLAARADADQPGRQRASPGAGRRSHPAIAASVGLALFAAGAVVGRVTLPPPAADPPSASAPDPAPTRPGWLDVVASYVRLYGPQSYAAGPDAPERTAAGLAQIEAASGLALDGLTDLEGLTLTRAQLLALRGQPLAQIVFTNDRGELVVFCILVRQPAPPAAPPTEFLAEAADGLNLVRWDAQPLGYLVLGRSAPETLDGYARALAARIAPAP